MSHGLLFERFLNPERVSMPDIDMDFDERRRSEMIRYATQRYGEERVAQIVTYSHDQGQGRPEGLGPRARPPVRGGGEADQGACRRPSWARTSRWPGSSTPGHARYKEAARLPRALRERGGPARGRRHRTWARGPAAAVGRARGRRHPLGRAAARRHPDHAPRAGRLDHHPARHGGLRVPRPAQDGLPGPAQPDDPRRRAAPHRGQQGRRRSSSRS